MTVDRARPRFAEISTAFPTVPESVAAARRFVAATLRRFEFSEPGRDQAVLVTSELVANAFATGRPPIRLRVRSLGDGRAMVEVGYGVGEATGTDTTSDTDGSGSRATLGLTPAGRTLVDSFASRWGSRPSDSGVLAWFEISDPPPGG